MDREVALMAEMDKVKAEASKYILLPIGLHLCLFLLAQKMAKTEIQNILVVTC